MISAYLIGKDAYLIFPWFIVFYILVGFRINWLWYDSSCLYKIQSKTKQWLT